MLACQVHEPPLPGVPCLSTVLLIIVYLLLPCTHPNLCACSGFRQDQSSNLTLSSTFDQLPGYLYLYSNPSSCGGLKVWGGLGSYMKTYYPQYNFSDNGFFITRYAMPIDGRSYSIVFTMSIYQSNNQAKADSSLFFTIQPALDLEIYEFYPFSMLDMTSTYYPFSAMSDTSVNDTGGNVSTTIYEAQRAVGIAIGIEQPGESSVANKYSVWIDYDHGQNSVLVYVDAGEGTSKPANAVANSTLTSSCIMPEVASFGILSSVGQLVQLHTWNSTVNDYTRNSTIDDTGNSTVDWLPEQCQTWPFYSHIGYYENKHEKKIIILSSVLGSAGAIIVTAAIVYLYLNSRFRRWKNEQDRLTKIMQGLPGVPTQVDFTDIKRATKNFHETMKLGKGGFGAVYRCKLPAASFQTGQEMNVAVKKFMRGVEDRRYADFLAEVSIINRLRHKNIVPLVGWSYNKGEPLLVYEYMTNGSLDQHLFQRSGTRHQGLQQQPPLLGADVFQWDTRYGIVRDIATGLHYVHNEHEPMVLHRDIKASNVMLDSNFRARLGDFGIACTVAGDRTSATGVAGTFGYMAPEYVITCKATRQTDIYAFGVLILEIITGNKNADVPADDGHITIWVRRLHREGRLLEAVNSILLPGDHQSDNFDEAKRLLLLGMACTHPNPYSRPSMAEVVQVITKVVPPPDLCLERPMAFGLPEAWPSLNSDCSIAETPPEGSSTTMIELVQVSQEEHPLPAPTGGHAFV